MSMATFGAMRGDDARLTPTRASPIRTGATATTFGRSTVHAGDLIRVTGTPSGAWRGRVVVSPPARVIDPRVVSFSRPTLLDGARPPRPIQFEVMIDRLYGVPKYPRLIDAPPIWWRA